MTLINQSIPNLVNGVSQQPAAIRLPTQCETQENAYSSLVEGLKKRPPTEHIAKLISGTLADALIHFIRRDEVEKYIVIATSDDIQVFDLETGDEVSVAFPDGTDYLTGTASLNLKAVTVLDSTFIVNTSVDTAMSADTVDSPGYQAVVEVRSGNYSTTYTIEVDATTETYTSDESTPEQIKTTSIAVNLKNSLEASLGSSYAVNRNGSTIWIRRTDGADFVVKASDSRGNTSMKLTKDRVQSFSDLPPIAPTGFVVEVVGDSSSNFDNYHVKFVPRNAGESFDDGVWEECAAIGILESLDASTMPHQLAREADGTFTFRQGEWGIRTAGDDNSAPLPSFVGRPVRDVFFYKDRLGFCSGENIVMSRVGEYFDFFRETVTTLLDSDVIDVAATHTEVSILHHAVSHNERLLAFSGAAQFSLPTEGLLTPQTAALAQTTSFESSPLASPVGAGQSVYFAFTNGSYSGVREFQVGNTEDTDDAADVTKHVPKYIYGRIRQMAVATQEDVMCCVTDADPETLYIYKYYWSGDEKIQSSWSQFTLGDGCTILGVGFDGASLYVVAQRSDGVYLEVMHFDPGRSDPYADFVTLLDRRLSDEDVASSYDSETLKTTFTLPYAIDGEMVVVTRADGEEPSVVPGITKTCQYTTGETTLTVNGDHTETPLWIGQKYTMLYRFGQAVLRERSDGGGARSVSVGRLQLRRWHLVYDESGYFRVAVTPEYRSTRNHEMTGARLGTGSAQVGSIPLRTGTFRFPVNSKNDKVTIDILNDTHLPSRFLSAEWEGTYVAQSQRV